ncbi:unnamed protein product [Scytosiphon promiscuus]
MRVAHGTALLVASLGCGGVLASASTDSPSRVYGSAEGALRPGAGSSLHGGAAAATRERQEDYATDAASSDALSFTATNEYPPVEFAKWEHVAEPFRKTTFTAKSNIGDSDQDVFMWSFPDGTVIEGRQVSHTFQALGSHKVTLSQIVVSLGEVHRVNSYVMVKYVRREIRALTDADREAFFDAMETLYRLPTAEGNSRYGNAYKGINFFVQMHLDGAGIKDCDHWHDDAGIMTHHVGYTLLFEQALQVVDPSVSIPYWEYTVEYAQGLETYGDSEIFAQDWFGEASPDNPLHTVDKGRWAYLPVKKDSWDYVHNSYGLLRTPWNVDGTPFVTRNNMTNGVSSMSMVSCDMYQKCFEASTMSSINNCLNGGTHGPVHILVGGEWNNPEEQMIDHLGYTSAVPLISKYLWRKGYLRTPESCSMEEHGIGDGTTCRASCPAEVYENLGMKPYDVLMDVHALYWIAEKTSGTIAYDKELERFIVVGHQDDEDFMDAFWKKMLHSLCDPGHVGELFTSSAPYDPLFWVIHPTADRFLAWRRKLAVNQPDMWALDEAWGYEHGRVTGETGTVCNWDDVEDGTLDVPTCVAGICGGHNREDTLPFEVMINGEAMKMTNQQWYDFIYPDNDDLPYLYDRFSWDHCAADGDFMGTPLAA